MRDLKPLAAIAVLLCGLTTACTKKDNRTADLWPRTVEPRLTGFDSSTPCVKTLRAGHVVEEAVCRQPAVAEPATECDDIIGTHSEAVRMLAFQARCTDAA